MEKRQLDFNAPLLSARRYSSPRNSSELVPQKSMDKWAPSGPARDHSLLPKKPDWEPEDITKPAAVPFHWEQTPGRPKYEPKARFSTPNTPKLPPGRAYSGEHPRLPPHRLSGPYKFNTGPIDPAIFSDHASLLKKLDESLKCRDESENSETENDEDMYSEAINALSLNESCSVSGLSGTHDHPVERPSGTFSVDKQTRDFMMSRFLPAAKAVVVLEMPQYAAKKPAVEGVVKEVKKKVVSGEMTRRPLVRKYVSAEILPYYYGKEDFDNGESEDEEDGDRSGRVAVKKAGKSWGIIPRICVKSSLCLLSPLPAMKAKSRPQTPTAGEERRFRRNAVSGPLNKSGRQLPPPPKKYHSGQLSLDLGGPHSHDSYHHLLSSRPDSPLRRYRSGSLSPYRSSDSPKGPSAPLKEIDTKIASSRKMFKALSDVSRNQAAAVPTADAIEKTVYVDSVTKSVEKTTARDVRKYMSGGGGLGVKEKIEGLDGEVGPMKSPLQPPLPKSPSESWLWRTLPSMPFGQSRRSGQVEGKKVGRGKGSGGYDSKWLNIVKSSNSRHDYARYSEELMPRASYRQNKS